MERIKPIKSDTFGDRVATQLRELIVLRRLPPGKHLAEDGLAKSFGVSRGPIRDALRDLEVEGLVETRGNRVYAREFTEKDIRDLYRLRHAIEPLALDDLARRRNQGHEIDWTPMTDAVSMMEIAADIRDSVGFAWQDRVFHNELYLASGNHRLVRVWEQIRPSFEVLLSLTVAQDADLHPSHESHALILDRVMAGQVEPAKAELNTHLDGALARMVAVHRSAVPQPTQI